MKRYFWLSILSILLFASCSKDDNRTDVRISDNSFLFASTNDGQVKRYNINSGKVNSFRAVSGDVTGLFGEEVDSVTILSKAARRLESYKILGSDFEMSFPSSSQMENPLDIAVKDNYFVVADDADADGDPFTEDSRLFVFRKNADGFTLRNIIFLKFRVWGVEFMGDDLLVSHKNTNKLALFRDFLDNRISNVILANKTVVVEGVTRVYGMDFEDDLLVLSDIGSETSDSDGSLQIMPNFTGVLNALANEEAIPVDVQLVLQGNNTKLGNPVKVIYDSAYNVIFVAEQLNGGGRILGFNGARTGKGNLGPDLNYPLANVSAIYFFTK